MLWDGMVSHKEMSEISEAGQDTVRNSFIPVNYNTFYKIHFQFGFKLKWNLLSFRRHFIKINLRQYPILLFLSGFQHADVDLSEDKVIKKKIFLKNKYLCIAQVLSTKGL